MHLHSFISASGAYPNLERTFFLEVSFLLWRHALICRRIVSALRPFHALFFNYLPNFCGDVKGKWAGQVEWVPIIGIGLLMSQHCCVNLPGQCCGQWTMDGGRWTLDGIILYSGAGVFMVIVFGVIKLTFALPDDALIAIPGRRTCNFYGPPFFVEIQFVI